MKDPKLVQEKSDQQTDTHAEMMRGYAAGLYYLQETMPFVFHLYTCTPLSFQACSHIFM